MAKAKRKSLLSSIIALIGLLVVVVVVLGAVFEIFITPKASKVEEKCDGMTDVSAVNLDGALGRIEAGAVWLVYGYSNSSLLEKVTSVVTITYKDGDNSYTAYVIYCDSMKDANTVREGISDKAKENEKVAMFRGKALVVGDKKAALKYYSVIF